MTTLEHRIIEEFKTGQTPVERALLVISGLKTEREIAHYQAKLDFIQEDFEQGYAGGNTYQTAGALFDYFWETKSNRAISKGSFLLSEVIDNQLDGNRNKMVGNCLGLTSLYTVLGQRLGLDLSVLLSIDHILTLFYDDNKKIVVENNNKFGFDYKLLKSGFRKGDLNLLVAVAFNNRGIVKEKSGNFDGALLDYNRALELDPDGESAFYNRGNVKYRLDDLNGALFDYDRALELDPDDESAFYNRKILLKEMNLRGK